MRYAKYNIFLVVVISIAILQQSKKPVVQEHGLFSSAPKFPGMGEIRKQAEKVAKDVVKKFFDPIFKKAVIAVEDAGKLVEATFNILVALGEIVLLILRLLGIVITRVNILQEIVLDATNIFERAVKRINLILDIVQNIITLTGIVKHITNLVNTGSNNVSDWITIQGECNCEMNNLLTNLYELSTRTFTDLYKDIVDIASFDIIGLLKPKEILDFVNDFKKSVAKIRRNINTIKDILDALRQSLIDLGVPPKSLPSDISGLISLGKESIQFMKLTPELLQKQKRFGKAMKGVLDLGSRAAAISNEVTSIFGGAEPLPKIDPRKITVNTFKKIGLDIRTPSERKLDSKNKREGTGDKSIAPWATGGTKASSRGERGELKCKPREYSEEKENTIRDKLKDAAKRASEKTASLKEDT